MTVGTSVESPDCPDARGIVVERRDSDAEVILKVDWVSLMGLRFSRWHFEAALTQYDTGVYRGWSANGKSASA